MKTQTRIDIFVCVQGVKETWVSKSKEGGRHCRQFHFYNRLPLLHLLVVILQLHFDFLHPNPPQHFHPYSHVVILHFNFTSLIKHPLVSGKESHFKSSYYHFSESWVVRSFLIVTSHRCHIDIWGSAAAGVVTRKDDFSVFSNFLLC